MSLPAWPSKISLDLSCLGLVVQATLSDGVRFHPFTFEQVGPTPSEVDVGRGEIIERLTVSAIVEILNEGRIRLPSLPGRSSFWTRMRFLSV